MRWQLGETGYKGDVLRTRAKKCKQTFRVPIVRKKCPESSYQKLENVNFSCYNFAKKLRRSWIFSKPLVLIGSKAFENVLCLVLNALKAQISKKISSLKTDGNLFIPVVTTTFLRSMCSCWQKTAFIPDFYLSCPVRAPKKRSMC